MRLRFPATQLHVLIRLVCHVLSQINAGGLLLSNPGSLGNSKALQRIYKAHSQGLATNVGPVQSLQGSSS